MISGLKFDVMELGGRPGVRYEVAREGFGLPLHAHPTRDQYHDIKCLKGPLIVFGNDWFQVLNDGEVFTDFDNGQLHGIASQGPAVWFNAFTSGELPENLLAMREDEKHTDLNARVDLPDWILKEMTK